MMDKLPFSDTHDIKEGNLPREPWVQEGVTIFTKPPRIECQYLKKIRAGDEGYYWCNLSDHPCMVEYNDEECDERERTETP